MVSDTNIGARRLYESHGYREVAQHGTVKEQWQHPGADWVLLRKQSEQKLWSSQRQQRLR